MIEFECPSCEARVTVAEARAGGDHTCDCGALLEIPSLEEFGAHEPASEAETIQVGGPVSEDTTVALEARGNFGKTIEVKADSAGKALCARHADRSAEATCERCGNFMCVICSQRGDEAQCPACRELVGAATDFPYTRETWSLGGIFDHAAQSFQRDWLQILLSVGAVAVGYVILFLGTGVAEAAIFGIQPNPQPSFERFAFQGVTQILSQIFGSLVGIMLARLCLDSITGKGADIGRMFGVLRKAPSALLQTILITLISAVPIGIVAGVGAAIAFGVLGLDFNRPEEVLVVMGLFVVILIPLFIMLSFLLFAPMELVYNDEAGAWQSIVNANTIGRDHRLMTVGIALLTGILSSAGMIACCIGMLATWPFAQMIMASYYLSLRNGSGLPPVRSTF